jgi:hypothetical protein
MALELHDCNNAYAKRVSSSIASQVTQETNYTLVIANCHKQRRETRVLLSTVRLSAHRIETDFPAEPSRSTQNRLLLLMANGHFTIFCPRDRYPGRGSLNAETRSTSPRSFSQAVCNFCCISKYSSTAQSRQCSPPRNRVSRVSSLAPYPEPYQPLSSPLRFS